MSVINRMLKDLDQRQHTARTHTYTPAAVAPQPIHWIWIVLTVVFSAAVILGGLNLWWMYSSQDESAEVVVSRPVEPVEKPVQPTQAEAKPNIAENQAIVDVSALPTPTTAVTSATPVVEEPQQTTPKAVPEPELEAITQPAPKIVKKTAEPKGTFEVTRVQLSPEQLAENNLEKARAAFKRGNRAEGQALLEKALVVKPDHVAVRSELAAYWYGRGMTTRALTLLQQGLDMKPQQAEWQLLFARILERIGRVEQAYTALVNIHEDAPEAEELLQLRAAAATQLGYFNEAAADYTVLATSSEQGRWWLAAAVAHEDADNLEAAVRCYKQAAQHRDLGADARDYVNQRLAVLEGY